MAEYIQIGKIINTHGVRGEVKVVPLTHDIKRFSKLNTVFIDDGNDLTRKEFQLESVRYVKDLVYLKFTGIDDMDAGKSLKNYFIEIDKKDTLKLPENTFYIYELIDMKVFDANHDYLGTITDVIETGSNDCYNIKPPEGREFLIPALKSVVMNVDTINREMTVQIPEGLLD